METMSILEEQVVENTVIKINENCQVIIPIDHNERTDPVPSCHIFSPVKSTFLEDIKKGLFNSVPGINQENIQAYLEKLIHVAMGCLYQ